MNSPLLRLSLMSVRTAFFFALLTLCAGCAPRVEQIVAESDYLTYEHAFTDAAAETARRSAERQCAQKKQVAIKTSSACTLTRCTAHYQCMDKADAAKYQQQEQKK